MNDKFKNSFLLWGTLLTVLAVVVLVLAASSARAANTTYYVDCSAGSNGNGTQSSPWNNLATVNGTTFGPGDQILFKRGVTCAGTLWPLGSGSSGSPITIADYGTGALPVINGGSNEEAIKLYSQQYWAINNIETTGGTRYGIFVDGNGTGVLHNIHITNAVVHDVTGGTMDQKTTGLVVFGNNWDQQFDDILVDNVTAYNTTMWAGIIVTGKDYNGRSATRSNNVTISNSTVYNVYGDGIVIFSSTNGLITNSVAYLTGQQPAPKTIGTPNGIWTWDCGTCTVQYSESYLASSPEVDGGGFDIDYFTDDNIVQYSYGHDNDSYCISIFATGGAPKATTNPTIRYNICSNNARDTSYATDRSADLYMVVWNSNGGGGYISGLKAYNNTFYWNPASSTLYSAVAAYNLYRGSSFSGTNIFNNNIVYSVNPNLLNIAITGLTLDYNLWWYDGTPVFKWPVNKTYNSFSAYQSGSGQDAHGLYANPMLNDPTYHGNGFPTSSFTLQSGSPAIDAGTNVGSMGSQDFFGNSIPQNGVYDIGAYEYGGAPQPTATHTPEPSPTSTSGGPTPTFTNTPVPPTPTFTNTPGGTTMHVYDIFTADSAGNPKTVFIAGTDTIYARAKIVDGSNNPVSGASVTFQYLKPDGSVWATQTSTTGADGWAINSKSCPKASAKGLYTVSVTNVTKSGWTYDSGANVKTSTTFTVQ